MPARLTPWLLLTCAGGYALALAVFGWLEHPIMVLSAEGDEYVGRAEVLRAGNLPYDPYRPLLYPLLAALISTLTGISCFAAAKLLSSAAAGALIAATFLLARSCMSPRGAAFTALVVAGNGTVLANGLLATSDMLFCAWVATTLLLVDRTLESGRLREVVLLGIAFAGAWFTRYQAIVLLVAIVPAIWCVARSRARAFAAFGATATCCLIPHFVLTALVFGSPLHAENWRTVAIKYFAHTDFRQLETLPFDGILDVLRHDPWAILAGGAATCWGAVRVQIPLLLQGGPPVGWFGWTLGAASALGIVIGWRLGARALRSSVLFATVFTVATCFAFHAWPRLLLPTLPVWLTGLGLLRERAIARIGNRIPSRGVALALASVVLLPMSVQSHARLTSFIEAHPWPEVNATRDEIRSGPQGIRVGGAYLHARRLFPENYVCLPSPAAGVNYLEELAERNDVDSIVIGPRTIGRTTFRRLANESVPRALEVIRWDDDVLVLRKMR